MPYYPPGVTFGNPTALVGLSAINGIASSAMRSDAAPALDVTQAFAFSGLGAATFASSSGAAFNQGTASEAFRLVGRTGNTFPVPYLTPTANNSVIAFDIFPRGTPGDRSSGSGLGPSWIDLCSTDIVADSTNFECVRLSQLVGAYSHLSSANGGTGVVRPLALNIYGGQVGIGGLPYQFGGLFDVKKNSSYNSENAGISIQTGTDAQAELLLGVDSAKGIAYLQSASRNTSFTTVPLILNPNGGVVSIGSNAGTADNGFSRISAGVIGVGTGANASFAGSLKLTDITVTGNLQLGNAYVATPQVPTGYIIIKDSTGTAYKIPANL